MPPGLCGYLAGMTRALPTSAVISPEPTGGGGVVPPIPVTALLARAARIGRAPFRGALVQRRRARAVAAERAPAARAPAPALPGTGADGTRISPPAGGTLQDERP